MIEIDGASRGMGILHVVKKIAPKKVRIEWRSGRFGSPSRGGSAASRTSPTGSRLKSERYGDDAVANEHRAARLAGKIPLTSLYTAGTGGQIFFHALKTQGKLIGTRCSPCDQVYLPARSFCERCFAELTEQVEVKRTGRLVSYTLSYVDHDGAGLRRPLALGLVQLEGATTLILHRLLGVNGPTEGKSAAESRPSSNRKRSVSAPSSILKAFVWFLESHSLLSHRSAKHDCEGKVRFFPKAAQCPGRRRCSRCPDHSVPCRHYFIRIPQLGSTETRGTTVPQRSRWVSASGVDIAQRCFEGRLSLIATTCERKMTLKFHSRTPSRSQDCTSLPAFSDVRNPGLSEGRRFTARRF